MKKARQIAFGCMGNGENMVGAVQRASRKEKAPSLHRWTSTDRRSQNVAQVVHSDQQTRRHDRRRIKPGHVQNVHAPLAQQPGQMQMRAKSAGTVSILQQLEISGKRIKLRHVAWFANQEVVRVAVNARELVD